MAPRRYPWSPLLKDPNQPTFRIAKGLRPKKGQKFGGGGGLLKYIEAVKPGPPPQGWRDITPFFQPKDDVKLDSLGAYKRFLKKYGYILVTQTVIHQGQTYRRIAVALLSTSDAHIKDQNQ